MGGSPGVEFGILGSLQAMVDGQAAPLGGPRPRLVLAALVMHANTVVSADRLIDVVWGEAPPDSAHTTLQKYVYRLRSVLDPGRSAADADGRLLTRPPGYLLRADDDEIDAARFARLVAEGRQRAAAGDLVGAAGLFDTGLALWRGAAMAEFADEDFARAEAVRLEGLRAVAVEDRAQIALDRGLHAELIGELEATVTAYPLRERPRGQLMLALYRSGRHADSLRAYQAFRRQLIDEVGLEPSATLQALEDDIILQKPSLDWTAPRSADPDRSPAAPLLAVGRASRAVELPGGTVTFVFSDIEGSTRLFRRLGHRYVDLLERHRKLLRDAVAAHGGVEIRAEGDALFLAFGSAASALSACLDGQRALLGEPWPDDGHIRVRMGVHTGEAAPRDGDYIALAMHQAARVSAAAHGGQVLISEATSGAVGEALPPGPLTEV